MFFYTKNVKNKKIKNTKNEKNSKKNIAHNIYICYYYFGNRKYGV